MKKIFTIIIVSLSQFCLGQNLVNNWSFEDTLACPTTLTQINNAVGWSTYKESPDYFNSCAPPAIFPFVSLSVPSNYWGYQAAKTGEGYAGLAVFSINGTNFREYAGVQLSQILNIGQIYFVSFYVSMSGNNLTHTTIASNKIGIKMTTQPYTFSNPVPINNTAHVYTDSIIVDTLNWVKISGSFFADSAYQYLCLGNFFTDSATSYIQTDTNAFYAYYYFDDIKISDDSNFVNQIEENSSINIVKVFPNPARDWIVLEGKGIKSVEITNALGSTIGYYPTTAFTLQNKIAISSLSCGVYFLKINMIDERCCFQKLIIQY